MCVCVCVCVFCLAHYREGYSPRNLLGQLACPDWILFVATALALQIRITCPFWFLDRSGQPPQLFAVVLRLHWQ